MAFDCHLCAKWIQGFCMNPQSHYYQQNRAGAWTCDQIQVTSNPPPFFNELPGMKWY